MRYIDDFNDKVRSGAITALRQRPLPHAGHVDECRPHDDRAA